MGEITHNDLHALGDRMQKAVEREVGLARAEFAKDIRGVYHRIEELKDRQEKQNGRVNTHAADIATIKAEQEGLGDRVAACESTHKDQGNHIARLDERTRNVSPSLGVTLTKRQRAAVISFVITGAGGLIEAARHVLPSVLAFLKGH